MPGIFTLLWRHPAAKHLGVLGLFLPIAAFIYYVCVESWTLGFSFFSLVGKYRGAATQESMGAFLGGHQGIERTAFFDGRAWTYGFFLVTCVVNYLVLRKGISGGIERLANIGMPLLIAMAVVLVVRALTLGTPDPAYPDRSVANGLGFIWNPDLAALRNPRVGGDHPRRASPRAARVPVHHEIRDAALPRHDTRGVGQIGYPAGVHDGRRARGEPALPVGRAPPHARDHRGGAALVAVAARRGSFSKERENL